MLSWMVYLIWRYKEPSFWSVITLNKRRSATWRTACFNRPSPKRSNSHAFSRLHSSLRSPLMTSCPSKTIRGIDGSCTLTLNRCFSSALRLTSSLTSSQHALWTRIRVASPCTCTAGQTGPRWPYISALWTLGRYKGLKTKSGADSCSVITLQEKNS